MQPTLDAMMVRRWSSVGLAALRRHQREIDELNVYPVPDGDTGTNLVLTMSAAHAALAAAPGGPAAGADPADTLGDVLHRLARGALLGARGNSGVILSQLLAGLADALAPSATADGRAMARALGIAATLARQAVAEPVEGTVLTVASAAADGAEQAASTDLALVVRSAAEAARVALARTPEQLPVLARAGVVDAGGRGLVVLLDALVEVVTGQAAADLEPGTSDVPGTPGEPLATGGGHDAADGYGYGYGYEVQYLLEAETAAVDRLKAVLGGLGDSLVVVGSGTGDWNVHVHVDDVGAAIEAGIEAGRPYRISVTRFADQTGPAGHRHGPGTGHQDGTDHRPAPGHQDGADHQHAAGHHGAGRQDRAGQQVCAGRPATAGAGRGAPDPDLRAIVVVAAGEGMAELFAAEGAAVVPANPSTLEILDAIRSTGAGSVVVLPNDRNVAPVAAAAADEARGLGVRVGVVPTRSSVQALAALAVRDEQRRFDDDLIAMAEAAGACRYAEVTVASREALTMAGRCRPGDVLALIDGEVCLIGADLTEVCRDLLDRLLAGGGELVTLLLGDTAPDGLQEALSGHLASRWPFAEANWYCGGQRHYPLLVGVE